ncbi:hypothetical protein JW752_01620 [Candidatus Peregrinibacteria bacterium]|nr:hypothetical protein [Candidatus Peregrinibacteria bacterium]
MNPHAAQSFLPNQCVEGKTKITIFHFGNDAPQHSDEVADAMDAEDCHPASWPHLLAVGADHPKLQLDQWPIVALGWSNRGFNPFLSGDGGSRGLGEAFFDGKCPACRFLAVCK